MIKDIVTDVEVLRRHGAAVTSANGRRATDTGRDLVDTAQAHSENCLGLAAIQIGVPLNVIVVRTGPDTYMKMFNPVIVRSSNTVSTIEEGCLSFPDKFVSVTRPVTVEVMYQVKPGSSYKRITVGGATARIIQHECDHLKGVLI
jgi:peptide deformylase